MPPGVGVPCPAMYFACGPPPRPPLRHLTAHVRTVHEKRRDYACPHCAAAFGHSSCVKRHVRRVHEKREEEDVYAV